MSGEGDLTAAQKEFDKWDKFIRNHPEHIKEEQRKEEEWSERNAPINQAMVRLMKTYVPSDIWVTDIARFKGSGDVSDQVVSRVWAHKALWLVRADKAHIAKMHAADLQMKYDIRGLDLVELRAVFASLPDKFDNDGDERKAQWRSKILDRLKQVIGQYEKGSLPKTQIRHRAYAASPQPYSPPPDATTATTKGDTVEDAAAASAMEPAAPSSRESAQVHWAAMGDTGGPFDPDAVSVTVASTSSAAFDAHDMSDIQALCSKGDSVSARRHSIAMVPFGASVSRDTDLCDGSEEPSTTSEEGATATPCKPPSTPPVAPQPHGRARRRATMAGRFPGPSVGGPSGGGGDLMAELRAKLSGRLPGSRETPLSDDAPSGRGGRQDESEAPAFVSPRARKGTLTPSTGGNPLMAELSARFSKLQKTRGSSNKDEEIEGVVSSEGTHVRAPGSTEARLGPEIGTLEPATATPASPLQAPQPSTPQRNRVSASTDSTTHPTATPALVMDRGPAPHTPVIAQQPGATFSLVTPEPQGSATAREEKKRLSPSSQKAQDLLEAVRKRSGGGMPSRDDDAPASTKAPDATSQLAMGDGDGR